MPAALNGTIFAGMATLYIGDWEPGRLRRTDYSGITFARLLLPVLFGLRIRNPARVTDGWLANISVILDYLLFAS